jgi:hypothetical protein
MQHFKQGFLVLRESNRITPLTDESKLTFSKLWLYPASGASAGRLVANQNPIYVGKRGAGEPMTPDTLATDDLPLSVEILAGQPPMKLQDVIVQGTAGDGIFFSFS